MYSPQLSLARGRVQNQPEMEKPQAEPSGLEASLLQLFHIHHIAALRLRDQTDKAKKEAMRNTVRASDLLVEAVNGGVQESFLNEKRIELEIRALAVTIIRYMKQTDQWLAATHAINSAIKGCDGSDLLDDTATFVGEKTARPNLNSLRGFDVVDEIKSAVNKVCGNVVSCADILAVAARDSVSIWGGPCYTVLLGRRDARNASKTNANNDLPAPFFNFSQLLANFQSHGLNLTDLVALSGGHTIGLARCATFRNRIYSDTDIDPKFAAYLQLRCPKTGGDNNTQPLDATTRRFDTQYFRGLMEGKGRGLLHSDQELFKGDGSASDLLVMRYNNDPYAFEADFATSMIKMGNLKPLTGKN